jgi:hypothetical protein
LVVPAVGDEPWEGGWLSPLNGALYPAIATRRHAERAPRCPAFKSRDSVFLRPNDETARPSTVCPGLHVFDEGYGVTWWDPHALALDAQTSFGVRREDLIVKDVPRDVVTDGRSRYDRWRLARADACAAGATPSMSLQTVRRWAAGDSQLESVATVLDRVSIVDLTTDDTESKRRGPTFGALVHAVLARAAFDADHDLIDAHATTEGRLLGARPADIAGAATLVERVLGHDLLRRAKAAWVRGQCRRESPVAWTLPDGTMLEGVVDLAFEEDGRWIVVDYKTDREIASDGLERYRRQIAVYAEAIARATGLPVTGVLVRL